MAFDREAFRDLYPFEGRFQDCRGLRMHFLDEGRGDPVVCVHGNPTWSFYFRNLVLALRDRCRLIVPDHIGCGLSDKPGDDRYAYRLRSRVDDLEALLASLGLVRDVTLVVHDWGGPIGLGWAARHPERVARLVILNTGAFPLPTVKPFPWPLRLGRDSRLGAFLVRAFNLFSWAATRACTVRPLPRRVRLALRAPYDSWAHRIATLRFVQDIPLAPGDPSWDDLSAVERGLVPLADRPALLCWGARDWVFDDAFLDGFRSRLPRAEIHRFPDAGHYVLEDAGDRIVPLVHAFLDAHPIGKGTS